MLLMVLRMWLENSLQCGILWTAGKGGCCIPLHEIRYCVGACRRAGCHYAHVQVCPAAVDTAVRIL